MKKLTQVVVLGPAGFQKSFFHYLNREGIEIGQLVRVPFGPRAQLGLVIGFDDHSEYEAKAILAVFPVKLPNHLIQVLIQAADYYLDSPARLLKSALPKFIRGGRFPEVDEKWARIADPDFSPRGTKQKLIWEKLEKGESLLSELKEIASPAVIKNLEKKDAIQILSKEKPRPQFQKPQLARLTAEQEQALKKIKSTKKPSLLHGVTSSGKTEIYLHLTSEALARGQSVFILVPEIALTPQLIGRFHEHFPGSIAVMHSHLSDGERARAWMEVNQSLKQIIIGSRSAIFAPASDIGLIVLDEYHDWSYKQDVRPFYDARRVAELLAKESGATLVFGSATPRVEDYYLSE